MKKLILLCLLSFLSFRSFGSQLEFRCEFRDLVGEDVEIEVYNPFVSSPYRRIEVNSLVGESPRTQIYQASVRVRPSFYELDYWGTPIRFTLDLFPDRSPRFGRTYQANFRSSDISNGHEFRNINCQYLGF